MKAVTVHELARHVLGRAPRTGADYAEAELPIMGGCEACGATVAAYNSCPSTTGYIRCAEGCIGDLGFATVEEAARVVFADDEEEVTV